MDGHRQTVPSRKIESRSHVAEWLRDPFHRTAAEALVANELRSDRMRCDNTGHQSRRRSTVAALQTRARLSQTADAAALDDKGLRESRYRCTKGAEHSRGRIDILRVEDSANDRLSICQSGQNKRAMRDGFIAGHANRARYLQRSQDSSAVAASVFSSRYLTMTGVCNESPSRCPHSSLTARAPGTTTAFSGMINGVDPCAR